MSPFLAEVLGTAILVLFGNGVVANVVLAQTKGHGGGWIVISAGWGVAVFVGAFCASEFSSAHLNPAVTTAMLVAGRMGVETAMSYLIAQFAGAMLGAILVFCFYREHFKQTADPDAKLACFCTAPNLPGNAQALFCEVLGTFALILPIFLMASPSLTNGDTTESGLVLGLGSLGLLPVGMLVFGIGLSLGGTTGYAINPARDLGPRLVHAILPVPGKRDSNWSYAWVPVIGPLIGATLAAAVYQFLN